jgi:FkbM family methyltransferase
MSQSPISQPPKRDPYLDALADVEDIERAHYWIAGRAPKPGEAMPALTRRALRDRLIAGKASLHQALTLRFGEQKWVAAEVLGTRRLWLNLCDRHVSLGCLSGVWEPCETDFMRLALKSGDGVVDAGANIGWFSLVAEQCVGPRGRVHAFEPQSKILPYLRRTMADNDLAGHVIVHALALSDRFGESAMSWDPAGANMGRAWLAEPHGKETGLGRVPTAPLDAILPDEAIAFMKIDTEGAEALVLAGARRLIARSRPLIMLEVLPRFLAAVSRCEPAAIDHFLAAFGYQGFALKDAAPLVEGNQRAGTKIFAPSERLGAWRERLAPWPEP